MTFGSIIAGTTTELIQETQRVSHTQLLHEYGFRSPIDFRNYRQFFIHFDVTSITNSIGDTKHGGGSRARAFSLFSNLSSQVQK